MVTFHLCSRATQISFMRVQLNLPVYREHQLQQSLKPQQRQDRKPQRPIENQQRSAWHGQQQSLQRQHVLVGNQQTQQRHLRWCIGIPQEHRRALKRRSQSEQQSVQKQAHSSACLPFKNTILQQWHVQHLLQQREQLSRRQGQHGRCDLAALPPWKRWPAKRYPRLATAAAAHEREISPATAAAGGQLLPEDQLREHAAKAASVYGLVLLANASMVRRMQKHQSTRQLRLLSPTGAAARLSESVEGDLLYPSCSIGRKPETDGNSEGYDNSEDYSDTLSEEKSLHKRHVSCKFFCVVGSQQSQQRQAYLSKNGSSTALLPDFFAILCAARLGAANFADHAADFFDSATQTPRSLLSAYVASYPKRVAPDYTTSNKHAAQLHANEADHSLINGRAVGGEVAGGAGAFSAAGAAAVATDLVIGEFAQYASEVLPFLAEVVGAHASSTGNFQEADLAAAVVQHLIHQAAHMLPHCSSGHACSLVLSFASLASPHPFERLNMPQHLQQKRLEQQRRLLHRALFRTYSARRTLSLLLEAACSGNYPEKQRMKQQSSPLLPPQHCFNQQNVPERQWQQQSASSLTNFHEQQQDSSEVTFEIVSPEAAVALLEAYWKLGLERCACGVAAAASILEAISSEVVWLSEQQLVRLCTLLAYYERPGLALQAARTAANLTADAARATACRRIVQKFSIQLPLQQQQQHQPLHQQLRQQEQLQLQDGQRLQERHLLLQQQQVFALSRLGAAAFEIFRLVGTRLQQRSLFFTDDDIGDFCRALTHMKQKHTEILADTERQQHQQQLDEVQLSQARQRSIKQPQLNQQQQKRQQHVLGPRRLDCYFHIDSVSHEETLEAAASAGLCTADKVREADCCRDNGSLVLGSIDSQTTNRERSPTKTASRSSCDSDTCSESRGDRSSESISCGKSSTSSVKKICAMTSKSRNDAEMPSRSSAARQQLPQQQQLQQLLRVEAMSQLQPLGYYFRIWDGPVGRALSTQLPRLLHEFRYWNLIDVGEMIAEYMHEAEEYEDGIAAEREQQKKNDALKVLPTNVHSAAETLYSASIPNSNSRSDSSGSSNCISYSGSQLAVRLASELWKYSIMMRFGYTGKALLVLHKLDVGDPRTLRSLLRHVTKIIGFQWSGNFVAELIVASATASYRAGLSVERRKRGVHAGGRRLFNQLSLYLLQPRSQLAAYQPSPQSQDIYGSPDCEGSNSGSNKNSRTTSSTSMGVCDENLEDIVEQELEDEVDSNEASDTYTHTENPAENPSSCIKQSKQLLVSPCLGEKKLVNLYSKDQSRLRYKPLVIDTVSSPLLCCEIAAALARLRVSQPALLYAIIRRAEREQEWMHMQHLISLLRDAQEVAVHSKRLLRLVLDEKRQAAQLSSCSPTALSLLPVLLARSEEGHPLHFPTILRIHQILTTTRLSASSPILNKSTYSDKDVQWFKTLKRAAQAIRVQEQQPIQKQLPHRTNRLNSTSLTDNAYKEENGDHSQVLHSESDAVPAELPPRVYVHDRAGSEIFQTPVEIVDRRSSIRRVEPEPDELQAALKSMTATTAATAERCRNDLQACIQAKTGTARAGESEKSSIYAEGEVRSENLEVERSAWKSCRFENKVESFRWSDTPASAACLFGETTSLTKSEPFTLFHDGIAVAAGAAESVRAAASAVEGTAAAETNRTEADATQNAQHEPCKDMVEEAVNGAFITKAGDEAVIRPISSCGAQTLQSNNAYSYLSAGSAKPLPEGVWQLLSVADAATLLRGFEMLRCCSNPLALRIALLLQQRQKEVLPGQLPALLCGVAALQCAKRREEQDVDTLQLLLNIMSGLLQQHVHALADEDLPTCIWGAYALGMRADETISNEPTHQCINRCIISKQVRNSSVVRGRCERSSDTYNNTITEAGWGKSSCNSGAQAFVMLLQRFLGGAANVAGASLHLLQVVAVCLRLDALSHPRVQQPAETARFAELIEKSPLIGNDSCGYLTSGYSRFTNFSAHALYSRTFSPTSPPVPKNKKENTGSGASRHVSVTANPLVSDTVMEELRRASSFKEIVRRRAIACKEAATRTLRQHGIQCAEDLAFYPFIIDLAYSRPLLPKSRPPSALSTPANKVISPGKIVKEYHCDSQYGDSTVLQCSDRCATPDILWAMPHDLKEKIEMQKAEEISIDKQRQEDNHSDAGINKISETANCTNCSGIGGRANDTFGTAADLINSSMPERIQSWCSNSVPENNILTSSKPLDKCKRDLEFAVLLGAWCRLAAPLPQWTRDWIVPDASLVTNKPGQDAFVQTDDEANVVNFQSVPVALFVVGSLTSSFSTNVQHANNYWINRNSSSKETPSTQEKKVDGTAGSGRDKHAGISRNTKLSAQHNLTTDSSEKASSHSIEHLKQRASDPQSLLKALLSPEAGGFASDTRFFYSNMRNTENSKIYKEDVENFRGFAPVITADALVYFGLELSPYERLREHILRAFGWEIVYLLPLRTSEANDTTYH